MSLRAIIATAVCFMACNARLTAQQGGPDPDGRRLTARSDSLAIYLVRGADTTRTGALRDELTIVRVAGTEQLRRVYLSADRVLGQRIDTITDLLATLRPVQHRSRSTRTTELLDFAAGRATGSIRLVNGDSTAVNATAADVFNASSVDLVLRASTLREGWDVTIPVFVPSSRAVAPVRARVTGAEQIGDEMCWRVQVDFLGTAVTFWVGQTTRALRQQVLQVQPDVQILFRRAEVSRAGRSAI